MFYNVCSIKRDHCFYGVLSRLNDLKHISEYEILDELLRVSNLLSDEYKKSGNEATYPQEIYCKELLDIITRKAEDLGLRTQRPNSFSTLVKHRATQAVDNADQTSPVSVIFMLKQELCMLKQELNRSKAR
jgi:hypothetical protein